MTPAAISASLRDLADRMKSSFPGMAAGGHLSDAAAMMDAGQPAAAQRHLHAAIHGFAPLQLTRHGIHDDVGHVAARMFMQQTHRHLLLVQSHSDAKAAAR